MLNNRPIIGITPQLDIDSPFRSVRLFPQYQKSIEKAGGIGIMIPLTEDEEVLRQIIDMCDGFLFTGGQDVHPSMYGETESSHLIRPTGYAPERDKFESIFYPLVKEANKPLLAICRGFQIINVLHGGSIVQELTYDENNPDSIYHPAWGDNEKGHEILVTEDTHLKNIFNSSEIYVNSFHHQGIKDLGSRLTVSGISPDGLIEAFDIEDMDFGVGVQWHPEVLYAHDIDDGKLFKALINEIKSREKEQD